MMKKFALLLLGFLATSVAGRQLRQAPPGEPEYFVRIQDGKFVLGCQPFYISGANVWELVEAAAGAPKLNGASIPVGMTGPELVRNVMTTIKDAGLNTVRLWAHSVNPEYELMRGSGEFAENIFRGLDLVVEEARKAGLKVNLAFGSQWTPVGGVKSYLKQADLEEGDIESFYTDPAVKDLYKSFIEAVLTRTNTVNGRVYLEDPTIFMLDIINENRCQGCTPGVVTEWYHEMADYIKTLDTNHLVTTGQDGFYGPSSADLSANPGSASSAWASREGQDFIADHDSPAIDVAVIHSWPDNWQDVSQDFQVKWIRQHVADAQVILNKPILIQEYGKWINVTAGSTMADRDTFVNIVFDEVEAQMTEGTALQGSMFWQLYLDGQEAAPTEGGGGGLFGVYPSDATFDRIKSNAEFVAQLNSVPLEACDAATLLSVLAPPVCPQGFEGADCATVVNMCVRNLDDCAPEASCISLPEGGFECQCKWGYTGDGRVCAPNAGEMDALVSMYWSQLEGAGCDGGVDVAYPEYSPGWDYDLIGAYAWDWATLSFNDTMAQFGSRTNVTLEDCMAACQVAESCESITYNSVLQKCFLKAGQCPVGNHCYNPTPVKCVSENDRGGVFEFNCGNWVSFYRKDMNVRVACADYPLPGVPPNPLDDPANLVPFEEFAAVGTNQFSRMVVAAQGEK